MTPVTFEVVADSQPRSGQPEPPEHAAPALNGPCNGTKTSAKLSNGTAYTNGTDGSHPTPDAPSEAATTSSTQSTSAVSFGPNGGSGGYDPSGIVVFSGGSAANSLVDVFATVAQRKKSALSYVIPISDNGGSSSELIRVFGGPGIGDLRSRLVRLIPTDDEEDTAIAHFFNYRLPKNQEDAKKEWLEIVEARSPLWERIPSEKKELIRAYLNLFHLEITKRIRPTSVFNFSAASIGNLFLTGARLFTGSLESGIYLLSSICQISANVSVLPAINTNFTHHIAAELENGTHIVGQNCISHPDEHSALGEDSHIDLDIHDNIEDANLPGSLPSLRRQYIAFSKQHEQELPARIKRIWYINPYGHEIRPRANRKVVDAIERASCVIYSIGSLYTSIVPSLILRGVGAALHSPSIKFKILILNSTIDRETGPSTKPFTAIDFVAAIARAAGESQGTGVVPPHEYKKYVTHVIHLEGEGTPHVDKNAFEELGISRTRIYGRKDEASKCILYDERALLQVLDATIGRRDRSLSRRNTMHESFT